MLNLLKVNKEKCKMADRFGFGRVAGKVRSVEKRWLSGAVQLAREEMVRNIREQTNQESGVSYPALSYLIDWVPKNPPRLVLTGILLAAIRNNGIKFIGRSEAILTIDPIDSKGNGYASYHQDGENQYKSKSEFQSEFVTQSKVLDRRQRRLLIDELDKEFR